MKKLFNDLKTKWNDLDDSAKLGLVAGSVALAVVFLVAVC